MMRLFGKGFLALSTIAILALITNVAACGNGNGKDPTSASLDSLPDIALTSQNASLITDEVTSEALSIGTGAVEEAGGVPVFDYGDFLMFPARSALKALAAKKELSPEQEQCVLRALGSLTEPQTAGCPTVTDNSTGNDIDLTVSFGSDGSGCYLEGCTNTGVITIQGTVDEVAGDVDITVSLKGISIECQLDTQGVIVMEMSGSGSFVGNGLTPDSTSFSYSGKADISIIAQGTYQGQVMEPVKGFIYENADISGNRSDDITHITLATISGVKLASGGQAMGYYSDINGTVDHDNRGTPLDGSDDATTIDLTGRIGWEDPMRKGKVLVDLNDVLVDLQVCSDEPASGDLTISAGEHSIVVTFDGATDCDGCAPWTFDGAAQDPTCWLFY